MNANYPVVKLFIDEAILEKDSFILIPMSSNTDFGLVMHGISGLCDCVLETDNT